MIIDIFKIALEIFYDKYSPDTCMWGYKIIVISPHREETINEIRELAKKNLSEKEMYHQLRLMHDRIVKEL